MPFVSVPLSRACPISPPVGPMPWLALSPSIMLPSLSGYEVGAPDRVISELNTRPACSPVNACVGPSRAGRHDSGPWWVVTAFHVRLLHPLLHAGLSRRFSLSPSPIVMLNPYVELANRGQAITWARSASQWHSGGSAAAAEVVCARRCQLPQMHPTWSAIPLFPALPARGVPGWLTICRWGHTRLSRSS